MTKHTRKSQNARNDIRNIPRNTKSLTTHSTARDCSTHGRISSNPPRPLSKCQKNRGNARKFFTSCTANCLAPFLFIASTSQHELTRNTPFCRNDFHAVFQALPANVPYLPRTDTQRPQHCHTWPGFFILAIWAVTQA